MRLNRGLSAVGVLVVAGVGLGACSSQASKLEGQLRKAGYTNVSAKADYDEQYNSKKKKKERKLDDYEATARAGSCSVEVEQEPGKSDYVVDGVNGNSVSFRNLSAAALIAELGKQGVRCG